MIDINFREELKKYLETNYVEQDIELEEVLFQKGTYNLQYQTDLGLDDYIKKNLEDFNNILRKYIRDYNKKYNTKDSDIYKKADISKEHFNKIINQKVKPQKKPLIALGLALDLTKDEIEKLLNYAGFHLTNTNKFDVIIMFCLEKNFRDIIFINTILEENNTDTFRK